MSKFCPIANTYTNCTDNCNSCLAEQENKKKEEESENVKANIPV
jgi:hypothetical protein